MIESQLWIQLRQVHVYVYESENEETGCLLYETGKNDGCGSLSAVVSCSWGWHVIVT